MGHTESRKGVPATTGRGSSIATAPLLGIFAFGELSRSVGVVDVMVSYVRLLLGSIYCAIP